MPGIKNYCDLFYIKKLIFCWPQVWPVCIVSRTFLYTVIYTSAISTQVCTDCAHKKKLQILLIYNVLSSLYMVVYIFFIDIKNIMHQKTKKSDLQIRDLHWSRSCIHISYRYVYIYTGFFSGYQKICKIRQQCVI